MCALFALDLTHEGADCAGIARGVAFEPLDLNSREVLAGQQSDFFVSRFVSTRVQSHAFSTVFRSLGGSQEIPETGRKRENNNRWDLTRMVS